MSYNSRDFTAGCEKKDYNQCLTTAETSLQAVKKGLQSMSYNNRDFTAGCSKRITINVIQQQRLHCRLLKKDYNQCLTTTETSLQAVKKGLQSMSYNNRLHCRL